MAVLKSSRSPSYSPSRALSIRAVEIPGRELLEAARQRLDDLVLLAARCSVVRYPVDDDLSFVEPIDNGRVTACDPDVVALGIDALTALNNHFAAPQFFPELSVFGTFRELWVDKHTLMTADHIPRIVAEEIEEVRICPNNRAVRRVFDDWSGFINAPELRFQLAYQSEDTARCNERHESAHRSQCAYNSHLNNGAVARYEVKVAKDGEGYGE